MQTLRFILALTLIVPVTVGCVAKTSSKVGSLEEGRGIENLAETSELPVKNRLDSSFVPKDLPSRTEQWRYNGSGGAESDQVSLCKGVGITIDTGSGQRCRWVDDTANGFAAAQSSKGFTAEIRMQVLRSTHGTRGMDFETCVLVEDGSFRRYFISVTETAVAWYGGASGTECIAQGLDNYTAMHTYRLTVRNDGMAHVYRDGKLLAERSSRGDPDRMARAKGSYLQWGEGAGRSEADAHVEHVAYDLGGPYKPSETN